MGKKAAGSLSEIFADLCEKTLSAYLSVLHVHEADGTEYPRADPGQDITLYDTSVHEGNAESAQESKIRYLEYGYGIINGRDLLRWGIAENEAEVGKKDENMFYWPQYG